MIFHLFFFCSWCYATTTTTTMMMMITQRILIQIPNLNKFFFCVYVKKGWMKREREKKIPISQFSQKFFFVSFQISIVTIIIIIVIVIFGRSMAWMIHFILFICTNGLLLLRKEIHCVYFSSSSSSHDNIIIMIIFFYPHHHHYLTNNITNGHIYPSIDIYLSSLKKIYVCLFFHFKKFQQQKTYPLSNLHTRKNLVKNKYIPL